MESVQFKWTNSMSFLFNISFHHFQYVQKIDILNFINNIYHFTFTIYPTKIISLSGYILISCYFHSFKGPPKIKKSYPYKVIKL